MLVCASAHWRVLLLYNGDFQSNYGRFLFRKNLWHLQNLYAQFQAQLRKKNAEKNPANNNNDKTSMSARDGSAERVKLEKV
jgi:hypothetical protein